MAATNASHASRARGSHARGSHAVRTSRTSRPAGAAKAANAADSSKRLCLGLLGALLAAGLLLAACAVPEGRADVVDQGPLVGTGAEASEGSSRKSSARS
ncbi:hypothetical protein [Streptomyces sp. NPDC059874]|uniref:hypothetical protein n=1 Tax=Streptomyces sp. NPDC059874 TaxID=3346983 RepID=UPI00366835C1